MVRIARDSANSNYPHFKSSHLEKASSGTVFPEKNLSVVVFNSFYSEDYTRDSICSGKYAYVRTSITPICRRKLELEQSGRYICGNLIG